MLNLLFLSLFLILPLCVALLLKVAGERLNQISLVNVTAFALLLFSVLGTFPLFYFLDDYRYAIGVQDKSLVLKVLFYSALNIVFFLVGVIFVRKFLGLNPVPFTSNETYPLSTLQKSYLVGVFTLCTLILFLYLQKIEKIALVVAFTEGVGASKLARSEMGNSFTGNHHWYKLVMQDLGALLAFTCYALWLRRKKVLTFIPFVAATGYAAFVAVMATEKAPFAWLLIGLFMVHFLVKSDGFIPLRKLIAFAFILLGVLIFSYILFMGKKDLSSALWSVFSRAFSGSISPAYFYLEFFPEHQSFLFGRTFPNPGGIMPYEPYRYTVEVMNWKFPALSESGVVGSAPTVFWGEAYANFGPLGIPLVAFFMGCITAGASFLISKIEINPLTIGFLVWLILSFKDLSVSGFSGHLYSVYIIFVSAFVVFTILLRGSLIIRRNRFSR